MARQDFGTYLFLLDYARSWKILRGPVCVVVLTSQSYAVKSLAKVICPGVQLICFDNFFHRLIVFFLGHRNVQFFSLNPIYCRIIARWPYSLFIYDQPIDHDLKESVSNYVKYFDEDLVRHEKKCSADFVKTYLGAREILDYRLPVFRDLIELHYKSENPKYHTVFKENYYDLVDKLGVDGKYVVLNINHKNYRNDFENRRRVLSIDRYNSVIDYLILKGYKVVVQGRGEQPIFKSRNGLIDYSKSKFCSVENDLLLYSGCEFAVMSKTGAEVLATICHAPILGLNYVELCSMQPSQCFRYFPKHLYHTKEKRYLHWSEILFDPCFFDIGKRNYNPDIEYREMEEDEMLTAVDEFLPLVSQAPSVWLNYTKSQSEFKESLIPLHMDLYSIKGVPCESYFKSFINT